VVHRLFAAWVDGERALVHNLCRWSPFIALTVPHRLIVSSWTSGYSIALGLAASSWTSGYSIALGLAATMRRV
jgi:hypothetical protein